MICNNFRLYINIYIYFDITPYYDIVTFVGTFHMLSDRNITYLLIIHNKDIESQIILRKRVMYKGVFNLCQHFEISYSRYAKKHFMTGV